MVKEGCAATAGFRFPLEEWKCIERIAFRLKLTVGDYLLGHVGYAVWLSRKVPTPLPEPAAGQLSLDHVTFRYPSKPDAPAVVDFTLDRLSVKPLVCRAP